MEKLFTMKRLALTLGEYPPVPVFDFLRMHIAFQNFLLNHCASPHIVTRKLMREVGYDGLMVMTSPILVEDDIFVSSSTPSTKVHSTPCMVVVCLMRVGSGVNSGG